MQLTKEHVWAIGLMSGTSLDGVDAALVKTDGITISEFGPTYAIEYDAAFQGRLKALIDGQGDVAEIEAALTMLHARAVKELLAKAGMAADEVAYIGFHGQTIWHKPEEGKTCQIGDGKLLARETGIAVVNDFRSNDMAHGGQGAPLVPAFHQALMAEQEKPVAILNIGGVANVTWIGEGDDKLIAFDTGPGNALINDWVEKHTGQAFDDGGKLAAKGKADKELVTLWLGHEYFAKCPPKSLDRNSFDVGDLYIDKNSSPLGGEQSRPSAEHKGRDVGGKLTSLARSMRKNPTDAENKLWYRLAKKQLGYRFRRQHPMGKQYIADFICLEKNLIIELDGSQHADQVDADKQRTMFLEQQGYRVLRFWNNDVFGNLDGVLETIWQALHSTPHASSGASNEADSQLLPPKGGAISLQDGAATLAEFSARAVAEAGRWFPKQPKSWYICGGGVHNAYLMVRLKHLLRPPVKPISELGYDGDMLEAQAFAFLAVRSARGLSLTFPSTTGVREPVSGGVLSVV